MKIFCFWSHTLAFNFVLLPVSCLGMGALTASVVSISPCSYWCGADIQQKNNKECKECVGWER